MPWCVEADTFGENSSLNCLHLSRSWVWWDWEMFSDIEEPKANEILKYCFTSRGRKDPALAQCPSPSHLPEPQLFHHELFMRWLIRSLRHELDSHATSGRPKSSGFISFAANKLLDSISARNATNQTTFRKVFSQQDDDCQKIEGKQKKNGTNNPNRARGSAFERC